ncbi:mucin-5AC isoform X1 [Drosophila novamexicana]|uniref:mucin-5AC isoform X1 n=1 Tax=Drosophila novamexicana TaxID=47314 RepID=UPI0011E5AD11|nr:mucin-5AC isoform X1 [Drosophila novamexicana]XP_030561378.1 mucin-5AC isoform X1 [Drosophila novamexicana]XP_030561379.1 mucin-5AC isoform X1 [Drosophila novamexicana]
MEVATTNNHSQSHHHHHLSGGSGGAGGGGNGGSRSPFQREVREWQRIDPNTGALFSGRLEADRWINGPLNSYGKISDSQNISQPNGTQHTQRKQMEVLRTANGAMQVIRTQTVQKTSSTSRWSTSSSTKTTTRSSTGAAPMALWAPRTSQGVDICELSNNDDDDDDDDDKHDDYVDDDEDSIHNGSDAGVVHECTTASMPSTGYGQELVDDHVDFVVINGHADVDDAADDDDDDNDVAHLHKLGHNLLLDTAPSLKLSNLMKSSSSISSQSSNNSNLTTAAATAAAAAAAATAGNTHRNAGKISLHAIVGKTTTTTKTTTTAATATSSSPGTLSTWPQRLEQADLYGQANNNSSSSSKRRVGVAADVAAVATPTLRRDLESFRHHDDAATADDDVDEDLRLSARHQRRQQVSQSVYAPPLPASFGSLQRSRSISTDDLSNDWQQRGEEQTEEELPCGDWRRVSKLRRSFQSQDYHNKAQSRPRPLPLDLPSSTVSVARIRAELENGRRLNTAMRNNHVDLAALDSILNTTAAAVSAAGAAAAAAASATAQSSSKPQLAKRSTFLTAASLQEIRGKLKKLSDESLYKEDFLAHQAIAQPAAVEVVQAPVPAPSAPSAFRVVHNTHSLETRQRPKDSSSSEWHLRRKSYGFEKMSPPENRSIFRVDASTDSGLGRSGEQLGNWSPTERSAAAAANGAGSTIIHFGRQQAGKPASPSEAEQLSKRHSIAVEETWRDIRKTSQVHVNGDSINGSNGNNSASQLQRSSAQKRVEFCKTEVHFAAESGRVNIVETDGKPPPTQNFRRRRRTASGPLQSLVKSASVTSSSISSSSNSNVTHFGDDPTIRNKTIASSTVAYRATLMEPPELVTQPVAGTQVTVITKPLVEPRYSLLETTSSTSRHSYTSTSGVDTTDNETDELANIRGILKNKPVKPKPYHLGENIESADVLWSVPATIKSDNRENSPPSRECAAGDSPITTKSVAERVRIVEQRQFDKQQQPSPAGNGYSTKINVSLGAEDWSETDLPNSNVMNIALHAPRLQKPKPTPPTLRIGQLVPVAKPRTLLVQPQAPVAENADESGSESLKIVKEARGARKLREHELSYFGVQHSPTPTQTTKLHVTPSNPRRTLPTRSKLSHNEEATTATTSTTTTTTKWQLLNDRPDLLRHSPQANDESNAFPEDDEEHCYENIANELTTTFRVKSPSPGSYERKTDLQRDAQILSEMTRNADQTMKALSDEAAFKDQRRRSCSLQRRSAKPLATIDEKVKTHNGDAKVLSVARGTFASEARRNSRQSTPSPTPARSSSQSSIECCPRDRSRSSSRESMTQGGGSSDEQLSKQRVERIRMRTPKREKTHHETTEQRSSRQSSKPRSSSNATPESKRTHHHSRHREKEHSGEHSTKHSSGSASGSRLLRSTRVSETSRPRTSSHRTSERERERERERTSGTEKHREELTRSRGHSSRSRHSEQSAAGHKSSKSSRSNHHDTAMSAHRKSTTAAKVAATKAITAATATTHKSTTTPTTATATATAPTAAATTTHNELTYVYVTNLANTQTAEDADYASIDEATVTVTPTALPAIPLPPPRRKRKRSLLPVPVQRERTTATPTAAYEHRIKLEMIPQTPSYSNQSTLRCKQQPLRKSSLKCTQSTSSSFAFLPYLPAKRNSSVSHVYDNYLLYAAPATLTASKLRPYQHNLSNEHAQLFGSSGRSGGIVSSGAAAGNGATGALAGRLGSWPKRLRMRQVRSSVSTHQPFGICTCS